MTMLSSFETPSLASTGFRVRVVSHRPPAQLVFVQHYDCIHNAVQELSSSLLPCKSLQEDSVSRLEFLFKLFSCIQAALCI